MVTLARDDPADIAAQLSGLLDDPGRRKRLSAAGVEFVRGRTWERTADSIEAALRAALATRVTQLPVRSRD